MTDSAVERFKQLIETGDIPNLEKEWPQLQRRFMELEKETGIAGRPWILDYYAEYAADLKLNSHLQSPKTLLTRDGGLSGAERPLDTQKRSDRKSSIVQ